MVARRATLMLAGSLLFGCGSKLDEDAARGGTGGTPLAGGSGAGGTAGTAGAGAMPAGGAGAGGAPAQVTYAEHVAPILFRECVGCHREGGIAPFPLTTYLEAADQARYIAASTEERHMPPMPVDNSGSCNTYSNARWLSDLEIATLGAWYVQGMPEGNPALTPALPPPPLGLERVDVTLDPGGSYQPNAAYADDYRCFIVDPGVTTTSFLVAYDVRPGDPRIVHHAIVYSPDTNADAVAAEALDAAEEGLGYTCFGGAGVPSTPLVLWAPGADLVRMPPNTGLTLPPGRKLIFQVHYNLEAGAFVDRTTVNLQIEPTVAHPGAFVPVADLDMVVAPGLERGSTSRTFPLDPPLGPTTVHGVLPHMHTLGRTLELGVSMASDARCLVSVDRWDFHWQNAWWYDEPIVVEGAESVSLSCGYDTRGRSTPVTWGEGTDDEMCLAYLYVTQ